MLFKAFVLGRNPFLELVKGPWAAGTSPGFFSVPGSWGLGASAVGVSPWECHQGRPGVGCRRAGGFSVHPSSAEEDGEK